MTYQSRKRSADMTPEALRTQIQHAAFDADAWTQALAALSAALEADSACAYLPTQNPIEGVAHDHISWNLPNVADADAIARETGRKDALFEAGVRLGLLGKNWIGVSQDLVTDRLWDENPFAGFFNEAGLRHYAGLITEENQRLRTQPVHISFFRRRSAGEFDDSHVALLAAVRDEAVRAASILFRVRAADQRATLAECALNRLSDGVILLDQTGRLKHANRAGETLFAAGGPLRLIGGMVCAATSAGQAALDRGLALLGEQCSSDILLERPDGGRAVAVLMPAVRENVGVLMAPAAPSDAALRRRLEAKFDLTPAEIDIVLRVFATDNVTTIAASRGVSRHTVRTQLKSIYAKMAVSRQAELLRLLHSLTQLRT
jgi:DNA-binding CsgD family transcriptional regulator